MHWTESRAIASDLRRGLTRANDTRQRYLANDDREDSIYGAYGALMGFVESYAKKLENEARRSERQEDEYAQSLADEISFYAGTLPLDSPS